MGTERYLDAHHNDDGGIESLKGLPTVFAEEFRGWAPQDQTTAVNVDPNSRPVSLMPTLSDIERRYLKEIIDQPGLASIAYAKPARISPKRAQRLRQALVDKGFLCERRMSTAARGRTAIVLEPLPAAFEALGKMEQP